MKAVPIVGRIRSLPGLALALTTLVVFAAACGSQAPPPAQASSGESATALTTTSSPAYVGCYTDSATRALSVQLASSGATVESCIAAAQAAQLAYAGVQYGGQCFGGNTLGHSVAAASACNMPCSADAAETCGGFWYNSIYRAASSAAASYKGCYTDSASRALPTLLLSSGATVESCIAAAQAAQLAYAGVQYGGQCFGGNTLGYSVAAASTCNMPCSANAAETCGGSWRNSIYAAAVAAAPTPAPTPVSTSTLMAEIAADMTDKNEGAPHGIPSGWGMAQGAAIGMGDDPNGWQAITEWGQVYEAAQGNPATNTRVNIRNEQLWLLSKSTGKWSLLQNTSAPTGAAYPEDFVGSDKAADVRTEPDGSISVTAGGGYNFHFYPSTRASIDPNDVAGIVTFVEARLIVGDPSKPDDRSIARYLVSAGADYYPALTGGWGAGNANPGVGVGRMKYVESAWRFFAMTPLTAAQLEANPVPANLAGIAP
ncbi:MAG TPA: WSC domain-containing protein [Anaeromyxobacteraceae bacterium]|nr:WSC domain-containing protein [Anaeromyxobacteraceae bacterium]